MRLMPTSDNATPRQKFPPPMTMAICTPNLRTSSISFAKRFNTEGEIAVTPSPISASPLILSRTRLYFGFIRSLPLPLTFLSTLRSLPLLNSSLVFQYLHPLQIAQKKLFWHSLLLINLVLFDLDF